MGLNFFLKKLFTKYSDKLMWVITYIVFHF